METATCKPTKVLAVYLEPEMHRRMRVIAAERGMSIGIYTRQIIEQFVEVGRVEREGVKTEGRTNG